MSDDRDIAEQLDDIAETIECGELWLIPEPIREAAAEIRLIRAEMEVRDDQLSRLRERVAELAEPLASLVAAKDEKDAHSETDQDRSFEAGAWDRARAAVWVSEEDS